MAWNERLAAWSERHVTTVDALGAAVVAAVTLVVSTLTSVLAAGYDERRLSTHLTSVVVLCVPLVWRRAAPTLSCLATFTLAACVLVVAPQTVVAAVLIVLVSLHAVTVHGPRWAFGTALGVALAVVPVMAWRVSDRAGGGTERATAAVTATLFGWVVIAAVWAFALLRRSRRERLDALRDRAERLEVERDQQALLATAAERARIARELHDIVAHSLSVMIAQADGGRYAAPADPAAAVRSLETVAETGRAALADMRRLLGVLRADGSGGMRGAGPWSGAVPAAGTDGLQAHGTQDAQTLRPATPGGDGLSDAPRDGLGDGDRDGAQDRAPRSPQPGIEGLDALVDQVRATGVRVSLVRVGTPRHLPPGAGLTVFRVAQEALTNVLKHAGPGPAVTVVLRWGADDLVLGVDDDGRGAASDGDGSPGFGILGMRERAAVFGGTVATGPRPAGGFAVRLELPLRYADASAAGGRQEPLPSGPLPSEPATSVESTPR